MPVTRDEVIWAYRMILGRDPESEAVISAKAKLLDVAVLRDRLLRAREFRNEIVEQLFPDIAQRFPGSVVVNSHRRSGTHIAIDMLVQEFCIASSWTEKAHVTLGQILREPLSN